MALSGQERREALRAAIKSAGEDWIRYRDDIGKNLGEMSMGELQEAFDFLWPDWTLEQWQETHGAAHSESTSESPAAIPVNPVTTPDSDDDIAKAKQLLDILRGNGKAELDEGRVIDLIKAHGGESAAALATRIEELEKAIVPTRVIISHKGLEKPIEGLSHYMLPELIQMMGARRADGKPLNIWVSGPTGSGKSHAVEQAAQALEMEFYINGVTADAFQLLGHHNLHTGGWIITPFRQAYEFGGAWCADELDAWDNSAILALNAALSNGWCAFGDSPHPVKRHPDFICVATANTNGLGQTAEYVGRNKLDASILGRFSTQIHDWDYDLALEQAMSGNPQWAKRVQAARERARKAGIKAIIHPRHSIDGAALIAAGMSPDRAAIRTYLAPLNEEQRRIVEG